MKKLAGILCLLLCLALLPTAALADHLYLIEDSSTRLLTEEELLKWDRESLSYIFNEIFARHGYVFQAGGPYDQWFGSQPWYTPNANPDNQTQVYPFMSKLEWDNYDLIKKVIAKLDDAHEPAHDPTKRCYSEFRPSISGLALSGFRFISLQGGQSLAVYSAPNNASWRGANGKASVSTNGAVYAAGYENGWLLIFYELSAGGVRVGYVNAGSISGRVDVLEQLRFDYKTAVVDFPCSMTDDPLMSMNIVSSLAAGQQVTYLTTMINQNGSLWDYIETTVNGQTARGFVPHGMLAIPQDVPEDVSGYSI